MRTPAAGGWRLHPRGSSSSKLTRRIISNVKITLLCAFVTLLVLRGTVGVNRRLVYIAGSPDNRADSATATATGSARPVEDVERILREIRADSDDDPDAGPDDNDEAPTSTSSSAATGHHYDRGAAWTTTNYRLQPRVTRWNAKRRRWLHQNPGFPSRDARGGPRVLLVTASPQGPCGSSDGDRFLLRATKNRLDYCRLHGVEMVHATARLEDPELRSAGDGNGWAKLALLRRLMLAHPEVEWLWWLDAGALVTDMGFELPLARYEGAHLVVRGDSYQLFQRRAWDAASTASFLLRNCQWSLDLLDAWTVMAPRGRARYDAGALLTATLAGRRAGEADDQSALVHLLVTEKERWMDRVYLENQYYLHGVWTALVGKYEEAMEKHHPGYGDDRWPFVTNFAGCNPCDDGKNCSDEYPLDRCASGMERAFNFADNQVLRLYGFRHESLASAEVRRVANRSTDPLEAKEEALAFLKKPNEPDLWSNDVRKNRKRKGKGDLDSVLARILRRLGWRSKC
ncbi:probable glycosyltransferase 3 [Zea mays]|uniref:Putative xyloglucan 6-xylosyltransferase 5 n=1 Tax=Zea mays TaxID=4577 RepID=K7TEK8_MAIZE|nr:probable glycosyltransferase 3 [Zea mays]AQK39268.1 putative xyloglucan 6-xylosyltransferase 5 [Zea mays]|eukprot:XP_008663804.1 probable glycosyltransferase 3 [Zea mays]